MREYFDLNRVSGTPSDRARRARGDPVRTLLKPEFAQLIAIVPSESFVVVGSSLHFRTPHGRALLQSHQATRAACSRSPAALIRYLHESAFYFRISAENVLHILPTTGPVVSLSVNLAERHTARA